MNFQILHPQSLVHKNAYEYYPSVNGTCLNSSRSLKIQMFAGNYLISYYHLRYEVTTTTITNSKNLYFETIFLQDPKEGDLSEVEGQQKRRHTINLINGSPKCKQTADKILSFVFLLCLSMNFYL